MGHFKGRMVEQGRMEWNPGREILKQGGRVVSEIRPLGVPPGTYQNLSPTIGEVGDRVPIQVLPRRKSEFGEQS